MVIGDRSVTQAAHEPVWRYIDPDGTTQGPFSAKEMHSWFEGNYLQTELPVCGVVSTSLSGTMWVDFILCVDKLVMFSYLH